MRASILETVLILVALLPAAASSEPVPADPYADQLTLYAIPAPWGMEWKSPRGLALQGIKNRFTFQHLGHKHFIGHVFVELHCSADPRAILTGMTTESSDEEVSLVMEHRYGLGVLGADMMGKLEPASKLRGELGPRYETGQISYIRFILSRALSKRLLRYHDEYVERGCDKHYGGANRPRYGEGGGCSPFGVSFLEVAGLMRPEFEATWRVMLRIPLELYGGPATRLRVPTLRILSFNRWANEDEPHVKIAMWDPSLVHSWVRKKWEEETANPTGRYVPELRGKARGLVVDCRGRGAPDEPIWLGRPSMLDVHPMYRQPGLRPTVPTVPDDVQ